MIKTIAAENAAMKAWRTQWILTEQKIRMKLVNADGVVGKPNIQEQSSVTGAGN
jgi:uncharacterized protein affecting Mg2+/Co2+ transport